MSISYQSTDDRVQAQELKWRTLILRENDTQFVPATGGNAFLTATPSVNVQQPVDNVAGSSRPVCFVVRVSGALNAATSVAVSGSTITPTFAATLATGDALVINYVVTE